MGELEVMTNGLPFDTPKSAAQDIVAELSGVMGLTLTTEQRDDGVAWLERVCDGWREQYANVQPSVDPLHVQALDRTIDGLRAAFAQVMLTRPADGQIDSHAMPPARFDAWARAVNRAVIVLDELHAVPNPVERVLRGLPLLQKLLDRLTNPKHHHKGTCSWCGVPMNQMHRIKSECPVSAAQGFQDELAAALQPQES